MDFKDFIKHKRNALGYSQNKFAKLIGITQSYFNTIERGEVKNPPSEEVLERIAEGLQLNERETENLKYLAAIERTPDIIAEELYKLKEELEKFQAPGGNAYIEENHALSAIPVYERISAGIGALNDGEVADYIAIPGIKNSQDVFAVNVCGDSMEPTLKNRSVIICRKNMEIRDGEIGAFLINDEAYVKRLKVTKQYVALMSDNPYYPPIYIGPGENLIAVGKVIKVLSDI